MTTTNPVELQFKRIIEQKHINLNNYTPLEIFAFGATEGAMLARDLLTEAVGMKNAPPQFLDGVGMYAVAAAEIMCTKAETAALAYAHVKTIVEFCETYGHDMPHSAASLMAARDA